MAAQLGAEIPPLRMRPQGLVGQPDRPPHLVRVGVDAESPRRRGRIPLSDGTGDLGGVGAWLAGEARSGLRRTSSHTTCMRFSQGGHRGAGLPSRVSAVAVRVCGSANPQQGKRASAVHVSGASTCLKCVQRPSPVSVARPIRASAAQRDLELGAIAKIEFEQAALFVFTPGEHDSSPYCGRTERVRHRHWAVCVLPFVAQHAGATV